MAGPEHTRFQPGVSGNPSGRPKLPPDIAKARSLNQLELERIVNKFLWLDRASIKAIADDPATPAMELMVAAIIGKAVVLGDEKRVEFILTRLLGKPANSPIKLELTGGFAVAHALPRLSDVEYAALAAIAEKVVDGGEPSAEAGGDGPAGG